MQQEHKQEQKVEDKQDQEDRSSSFSSWSCLFSTVCSCSCSFCTFKQDQEERQGVSRGLWVKCDDMWHQWLSVVQRFVLTMTYSYIFYMGTNIKMDVFMKQLVTIPYRTEV